jgi:pyroglutamyl-peptidase
VIFVTGFGPFGDVSDNPAARVARACHGCRIAGQTVIGRVIPVSFVRGPAETIAVARALQPRLVVGVGVAIERPVVTVEQRAQAHGQRRVDVDGAIEHFDACQPNAVSATLDVERLAAELGAEISTDAGTYVCNSWLYRVTLALPDIPVGFVHVPCSGLDLERLLRALGCAQEY